jgi:beta-xylosidase
VIKEWTGGGTNEIQLENKSTIKTVLYADDQVVIAKPEDDLQIAAHQLSNIAKKYNLKISTSKTKSMGMKSED